MAIGKLPDASDDGDEGGESIFAEINITPLTDVFLVMVIIFMVSALAAQVERNQTQKKIDKVVKKEDDAQRSGIKVNLPQGQAQEIDPSKVSLILVVPIEGDVNVTGKPIGDKDLDNLFRASFARDKQTQVIIKADKGVPHGRIVNLMERAKSAGLSRLAFGTSGG